MMIRMTRVSIALAFGMLMGTMAWGQEFRSTITGRVTDPQGLAVAGSAVTAIQVETGAKYETTTASDGQYAISFLTPGTYRVEAQHPGFKTYSHDGLEVGANRRVMLDIPLEIGQSTQTVKVTGDAPLLEAATASVGQVIGQRDIENMPLNGRTPLVLAQLAYGVTPASNPLFNRPFDNSGPSGFSMGGVPSQTNELLIDGSPDSNVKLQVAYNPPLDSVSEVKVEAFQSDAAYGNTAGGTVNVVLKSGTNAFHGTAYEFNQVSRLEATPFFTNLAGQHKQPSVYNQYGVTTGGPVMIPKVFDGRNRIFLFFAYEGVRDILPMPSASTVPTSSERQGDFSALLKVSTNYQIFDPSTGVVQGSNVSRQPFANNVIPTSRLSPIALKYLQYYPQPNQAGRVDGLNNFETNTDGEINAFDNEIGRLDFNISDHHKLFLNVRHNNRISDGDNLLGHPTTDITATDGGRRTNFGAMLDEVYTITPTLFLDTRMNWTRYTTADIVYSNGFDITSLGFPSYIAAAATQAILPAISFSNYTGVGVSVGANTPYDIFQIFSTATKVVGPHTLKGGADLRLRRLSSYGTGYASGSYSFGTSWTNGPLSNAPASPIGQDLASFLLGLPTGGEFDINAASTAQSGYFALFLQDDYRVRPNLTLNLGLRYERDTGMTERYNRSINGFDSASVNAVTAAAMAAYKLNPTPLLASGQFDPVGGLLFASPNQRNIYNTDGLHFSPRFGFSWQPKLLGSKTVIRGGTGVFFAPITETSLNQSGFSQADKIVPTLNSYLTPAATFSNPYPSGFVQPTGSSLGLNTYLGQSVTFFNPNPLNSYSIRWDLDIQRQLGANTVLEAGYMGNHAVHLPISRTLDYVPAQYLSTLPARDQNTINALTANVANPFANLLPGSTLSGSTVSVSQLLYRYPQFTGITEQNDTGGSAYFHMLMLRIEHRFSHNLEILANYAFSKMLERLDYLNPFDAAPEKRVAPEDRPQRLELSASYDLPKLKGMNPLVRYIAGGWVLNGIYTVQSGPPLSWGNVIYYGGPLNLEPRNIYHAFDITQFNTNSKLQLANNIRTFPTQFANLRADGVNNIDASLIKNFPVKEILNVQFRFEAFNALNRVEFNAPSTSPTSSSFGTITGQTNLPRVIQMALRIRW